MITAAAVARVAPLPTQLCRGGNPDICGFRYLFIYSNPRSEPHEHARYPGVFKPRETSGEIKINKSRVVGEPGEMSDSIRHRARHCGRGREKNLFKIKAMNYSFIIYTLFCVFYLIVVGIQLIRSRLFGPERSAWGAERDGRRESFGIKHRDVVLSFPITFCSSVTRSVGYKHTCVTRNK